MVIWQMPHFYSIAIFRLKDYKAAKLPVLPLIKGVRLTKIHITIYTIALIIAFDLLYFTKYTGKFYLVIMTLLGLIWTVIAINGLKRNDNTIWAKLMFRYSLILLLIFSVLISLNPWLN